MSLPLSFVLQLGEYLHQSLQDYAKNIDTYGIRALAESPQRPVGGMVRASALSHDGCPKYAAAIKHGLVTEQFDSATFWKFASAKYIAMMAKVAIVTAVSRDGIRNGWKVRTEYPILGGNRVSNIIDVLITVEDNHFPVELKWTKADYHEGLYSKAVWQAISNMVALSSEFGFVITLYHGDKSDLAVWPIVQTKGGWRVYKRVKDANDEWVFILAGFGPGFPADSNGLAWFSDELYNRIVTEHVAASEQATEQKEAYLRSEPPFHDPFAKPCAREYAPPEAYKRGGKYGKKGDLKPGTGKVTGLCPLYAYCFERQLAERQVPHSPLPEEIGVEVADGLAVFRLGGRTNNVPSAEAD